LSCIYVFLPGIFLLFYQRKSVRETCQRCDPNIPWTDRCPMPVLALSILLGSAVAWMPSALLHGAVMPLFGVLVSGVPGAAVLLLVTAAMAYFAWGNYRMQMVAWWGMLAFCILGTVNTVVTFMHTDMLALYQKTRLEPVQLEMMQKSGLIRIMRVSMPSMCLLSGLAWLGYLIYVRQYFVRKAKGELDVVETRPSEET
jgi:hypothetical protein